MGIVLFKKLFQSCIVLAWQGSLLCRRSFVSLMGGFIGTSTSVVQYRIGSLALFLDMLYSTDVRGYGANKACWKPAMRRGFEVRGFYHSLSPSSFISFPWKMVWQSKVPCRVVFFSLIATLGKILTTNILWIRHIAVLYVQKVWGIGVPFSSSLAYCI